MSVKSSIKTFFTKLLKAIVTVTTILLIAFQAPTIHRDYIRNIAEKNVVRIVGMDGMGTGFHVVAPDGKTYILTNKHVCNMIGPLSVEAYGKEGHGIIRKVIAKSKTHDLCIMEALPGVKGIKIASAPFENGETAYTLGHPRGEYLNVAVGEKFNDKSIQLGQELDEDGTCHEGTLTEIPTIFGVFKICLIDRYAVQFSTPTYPGNSGSPVVNRFGYLESVIFAGDEKTENQGFGVPLFEINFFLNNH